MHAFATEQHVERKVMWLRAGRREQSRVRGTNNDSIVIKANICYDSTMFSYLHDTEFHEYDDIVNQTTSVSDVKQPYSPQYENIDLGSKITGAVASSAHVTDDSVFSDHHNEDYDDIVNQRMSLSSKWQPPSLQCESVNKAPGLLASSVHLSNVPREYEIPVHSNSAYEIRDTVNDYEN